MRVTAEHQRRVELMICGAFDSPVFAVWGKEETMRNNDPSMPWNQPEHQSDPREPYNRPEYRDDPSAPWNYPGGNTTELERWKDNHGFPSR